MCIILCCGITINATYYYGYAHLVKKSTPESRYDFSALSIREKKIWKKLRTEFHIQEQKQN